MHLGSERFSLLKAKLASPFQKRDLFFYLLILAFAFQLVLTLVQCRDLVDDAYISARYAKNLAKGFGLVYNRSVPSQPSLERVEGYSNFLWVLLLALGIKLGLTPRFIAQFLGVLFGLSSCALLFLWVKKESQDKWLALASVSFLATNLYFAIWQVEGLETPLFSLLLIASIYALSLEKKLLTMILSLLLALTRPDGLLLFFCIFLTQFWSSRNFPSQKRKLFLLWLWFIVPYLLYFLGRAIYYHSLLPNTFYAKTGLGITGLREGAIYLGSFFKHNLGLVILGLVMLPGAIKNKQISFSVKIALAFAGIYLLFLFLVGGDWMPGFRLLVPLLPLFYGAGIILSGRELLPGEAGKKGRKIVYAVVVIGMILGAELYQVVRYSLVSSFEKSWHRDQAKFYLPTAKWLLTYVWQNQSLALGDIGYIGYFGDHHRIIDTMGLVNRHLGRLPGISSLTTDLDYIFSQEPFCIVSLVHRYPEGVEIGHSEFDRKLANDARLKMEYRLVEEIFGWDSEEVSRTDWKKRKSKVYFKIYLRNAQ